MQLTSKYHTDRQSQGVENTKLSEHWLLRFHENRAWIATLLTLIIGFRQLRLQTYLQNLLVNVDSSSFSSTIVSKTDSTCRWKLQQWNVNLIDWYKWKGLDSVMIQVNQENKRLVDLKCIPSLCLSYSQMLLLPSLCSAVCLQLCDEYIDTAWQLHCAAHMYCLPQFIHLVYHVKFHPNKTKK